MDLMHLFPVPLLALPVVAAAAGFDCDRAATAVELRICASPTLSRLDERLARDYRAALDVAGPGASCLRDDQRRWLHDARDACSDDTCLEQRYASRLRALAGLLPGAMLATGPLDAPADPGVLAFILPAAEGVDTVAPGAPSVLDGQLVEVEGGYRLLGDATAVSIETWALPEAALHRLQVAALTPAARYRLEGRPYVQAGGDVAFDPAACVLAWRIDAEASATGPVAP